MCLPIIYLSTSLSIIYHLSVCPFAYMVLSQKSSSLCPCDSNHTMAGAGLHEMRWPLTVVFGRDGYPPATVSSSPRAVATAQPSKSWVVWPLSRWSAHHPYPQTLPQWLLLPFLWRKQTEKMTRKHTIQSINKSAPFKIKCDHCP
jgi:hypothetical protein